MNKLTNLNKGRESEFKELMGPRYTHVKRLVDDVVYCLTTIFNNAYRENGIDFSNIETLETSLTEAARQHIPEVSFRLSGSIRKDYSSFHRIMFDDFYRVHDRDRSNSTDGKICALHFLASDYLVRHQYLTSRVGLYGNFNGRSFRDIDNRGDLAFDGTVSLPSIKDCLYVSLVRTSTPYSLFKANSLALLSVDINETLMSGLSIEEMRTSTFRDEVFNVIANKLIKHIYTNIIYFTCISNYGEFKNILLEPSNDFEPSKNVTYFDLYMNIMANLMSSNSVNNVRELGFEDGMTRSLTDILNQVKAAFVNNTSFNVISTGVDFIRSRVILKKTRHPVFIEGVVDRFLIKYRDIVGGNTGRSCTTLIPAGFSLETCANNMTNNKFFNENGMILSNMLGLESKDFGDKFVNSLRGKKRIELVSKMSGRERDKLVEFESELMKTRADMMNCEGHFIQKALIKRLAYIGKDLTSAIEGRSTSDSYKEMLQLLEEDRYSLLEAVSSKDFLKSKRTRIYGIPNVSKEFDY